MRQVDVSKKASGHAPRGVGAGRIASCPARSASLTCSLVPCKTPSARRRACPPRAQNLSSFSSTARIHPLPERDAAHLCSHIALDLSPQSHATTAPVVIREPKASLVRMSVMLERWDRLVDDFIVEPGAERMGPLKACMRELVQFASGRRRLKVERGGRQWPIGSRSKRFELFSL
jgi:hypothetical protein